VRPKTLLPGLAAAVLALVLLAPAARAQQVFELGNGGVEMRFRGGCVVTYDRAGRRVDARPACTGDELMRADAALGVAGQGAAGGGGTTADAPILTVSNGAGRAAYANGCQVFYDASGKRASDNARCVGDQVRRADAAMAAYRDQHGLDGQAGGSDAPLLSFSDGAGRAAYANGCQVFYDATGRRTSDNARCVGDQVRRADIAMAAYRAEHGLDGQGGSGAPTLAINAAGQGRASFPNGCQVFYDPWGDRTGDNGDCTAGQVRRADAEMAAYREEEGLDDGGDDLDSAVILVNSAGYGRASYPDGCQVFYGPWGDRTGDNGQCSIGQVRRADGDMAAYRYQHGLDGQAGGGGAPAILLDGNGFGRASFPNGCQVFYDSWGDRTGDNGRCASGQGRQADLAMAEYRRQAGLN